MSEFQGLFSALPKGSISDIIIDRITNALISGELKPGDKIPTEVEFSEKLGVGRNGVREAIKVLVAFGVLEIRRSEGTFVVEDYNDKLMNPMVYGMLLSNQSMEELLDFKIAIANSITYLAVEKATEEDTVHLRTLGNRFRKVMRDKNASDEDCYQSSMEFNSFLNGITGNRMLIQVDDIVHRVASFTRHKAIEESRKRKKPDLLPDSYLEQVEVIASGDPKNIPALMKRRLEIWKELLM